MVKYKSKRQAIPAKGFYGNAIHVVKKVASSKAARTIAAHAYKRMKGSYTKTQKKANTKALEISQHNDLSRYNMGLVSMGPKKRIRSIGKYKYRETAQHVMQGSQGFQNIDYIEVLFTRSKLVGSVSNLRANRLQSASDFYQLNPYSNRPTTTYFPGPPPAVEEQDKMAIQSVNCQYDFLSLSNVAQVVDFYLITPKYDTNFEPIGAWIQALGNEALGEGVITSANVTTTTTMVAGKDDINAYGNDPQKCRPWNKLWRVLKKKTFVLQPGDQRCYSATIRYNKVCSKQMFTSNRTAQFIKGYTVYPMIIAKSGLVGIQDGSTGTAVEVAHAATKVGVSSNYVINFASLPATRFTTSRREEGLVQQDILDSTNIVDDTDQVKDQTFA